MELTPAQPDPTRWTQELHPSFLRHAPRRIQKLARRCLRLCEAGWDINLVAMLHNDTAILAGQCGSAGMVEESHQLHALEQTLGQYLQQQRLPTQEELEQLQALCGDLLALEPSGPPTMSLPSSAPQSAEAHALDQSAETDPRPTVTQPPPPASAGEMKQADHPAAPGPALAAEPGAVLPTLPADGWVDPATFAAAGTGDSPPDTATAEPKDKDGPPLVVCAPETLPRPILEVLHISNYPIKLCENWAEAIPLAQSVSATALILPSQPGLDPARIKADLERLNQGLQQPVNLLVAGVSGKVQERVAAMRMGAQRFIPADSPADKLLAQLRELTATEQADRPRVLVVDDDESQARFASSILEKAGMEVRYVTVPYEALELLDRFQPDLILMDLYMPELNGAELTSLIRENEAFLGTPIVFLSGEQDEERQFEALQMGADDFLEKPIKPKHLIAAVKSRIQRTRKLHQRKQAAASTAPATTNDRSALIDQLNALLDEDSLEGHAFVYLNIKNRIAFKENLGYEHLEQGVRQIVQHIQEQIADSCSVALFGEFTIGMLCHEQQKDGIHASMQALIQALEAMPVCIGSAEIHPELSIGYTFLEDNPRDAARIISQAEKAAHRAAEQQPSVASAPPIASQREISKDEQQILDLIRNSLHEESLQLLFQPLINLNDNSKEQYQSLLRLMTPEQDFLPASRFIPVAEKHGLIADLDRWVMGRALDALAHRERLNRPIRLFVSQSIQFWNQKTTVEWLMAQLNTGFSPALLCLEFNSEHLAPETAETLNAVLRPVRDLGVRICLARHDHDREHRTLVEMLRPEYTKLNPMLVHDSQFITQLPETVAWLHAHDSKVIIPRVEQAMDAASLWTSGVDYLQGNFIQSPDSRLQFDFQGSAF